MNRLSFWKANALTLKKIETALAKTMRALLARRLKVKTSEIDLIDRLKNKR